MIVTVKDGLSCVALAHIYAGQLKYEARLRATSEGGTVRVAEDDVAVVVENADAATLYFVAATNFESHTDVGGDEAAKVAAYLAGLEGRGFEAVKDAAVADHAALFSRVRLEVRKAPWTHVPPPYQPMRACVLHR